MNQMYEQNIYHANVNVNLMVENVVQIKNGITINNEVSPKSERTSCAKKEYIWNPATCSCENGKYLAIIDNY